MKPKLKIELVRIEYWDCGNPDHRHKTEAVAGACIEKRESRSALSTGARKWTREAYAALLKERRSGVRVCDIARRIGLSVARTSQILAAAEWHDRRIESAGQLAALSVRTRNCLRGERLLTVEAVREALEDGRLDGIPNFGKVSKAEVRQWLEGQLSARLRRDE